jgi:hypothetical protein
LVWLIWLVPFAPKEVEVQVHGGRTVGQAGEGDSTHVRGRLDRLPLEFKVSVPLALAQAMGSWITLPVVEMPVPTTVSFPAAFEVVVFPVIPAAVMATFSAVV